MNVTNIGNETSGLKPFRYLNSAKGKEFRMLDDPTSLYNSLSLGSSFAPYLGSSEGSVVKTGDRFYTNPFQIDSTDLNSIGMFSNHLN